MSKFRLGLSSGIHCAGGNHLPREIGYLSYAVPSVSLFNGFRDRFLSRDHPNSVLIPMSGFRIVDRG
jgi:hypothetical protein